MWNYIAGNPFLLGVRVAEGGGRNAGVAGLEAGGRHHPAGVAVPGLVVAGAPAGVPAREIRPLMPSAPEVGDMEEFGGDLGRIVDSGVMAVMRGADPDSVVDLAEALHAGGVTAMEVTADTPGAMEMISRIEEAFGDRDDVVVGAGTVLDAETARAAILAGARFVVAPTFDGETVELCNRYDVVSAPGVFTPTEALRAYEAGADMVKIFPAKSGGPGHVSAIRGPLEQIPVMPTGGVGPDNAADYVEAGAAVVGVGSALVDDEAVAAGDFESITETARELVESVEAARGRD